ncbi:hypothetical protein K438DRAFT_1943370 [Mycena galopus ATCC 62051]|nr:hypothetical protein K438DRAFT_1943370 [Mycena galopus ATCC 62051]
MLTIWAGVCGVRMFFVCYIIRAMCELRPASHMLPVYPTYPYLCWSQRPLRDCTAEQRGCEVVPVADRDSEPEPVRYWLPSRHLRTLEISAAYCGREARAHSDGAQASVTPGLGSKRGLRARTPFASCAWGFACDLYRVMGPSRCCLPPGTVYNPINPRCCDPHGRAGCGTCTLQGNNASQTRILLVIWFCVYMHWSTSPMEHKTAKKSLGTVINHNPRPNNAPAQWGVANNLSGTSNGTTMEGFPSKTGHNVIYASQSADIWIHN